MTTERRRHDDGDGLAPAHGCLVAIAVALVLDLLIAAAVVLWLTR